jgi:hypothetical protein
MRSTRSRVLLWLRVVILLVAAIYNPESSTRSSRVFRSVFEFIHETEGMMWGEMNSQAEEVTSAPWFRGSGYDQPLSFRQRRSIG